MGGVVAQALRTGLEALNVAVVVGAQHVDRVGGTALELEVDVGEVRSEVGVLAVGLEQHAILVVTEVGGAEPGRAVLLEDAALGAGAVDRGDDGSRLVQAQLARPQIELDAHAGQTRPDALDHQRDALGDPLLKRSVIGHVQLGGDHRHFVTGIATLRDVVAEAARLHRLAEQADLIAGVVDVVLARHPLARELKEARDAVAVGGVAGRADRQITRRVGRHEFHQRLDARRKRTTAEVRASRQHVAECVAVPLRTEADVDEPGACDLDRLDRAEGADRLGQLLGDLARLAREHGSKPHRDAGRVVAVLGVGRPLEGELGDLTTRQSGDGCGDGGMEIADRIGHPRIVAKAHRTGGGAVSGGTAGRG